MSGTAAIPAGDAGHTGRVAPVSNETHGSGENGLEAPQFAGIVIARGACSPPDERGTQPSRFGGGNLCQDHNDNRKIESPMMRCEKITIAAAMLCTCALTTASYAQETTSGVESVDTCISLETREQLLECYEDRIDEVLRAREANGDTNEPETTTVSDSPTAPEQATTSSRAERREARETERRQRDAAAAAVAAAAAATAAAEAAAAAEDPSYTAGEIIANITAIREMEPDAYLITLDNGQTWRQNAPKRYLLRIGSEVHLRPSTWGPSYRLTDPEVGDYIQVKRVE